jgi:hypothetical protein
MARQRSYVLADGFLILLVLWTAFGQALLAGCKRGNLWMHSYFEYQNDLFQDGETNPNCANQTFCELQTATCACAPLGYYEIVVHGVNRTTGGEEYPAIVLYRYLTGAGE